MKYQIITQYDLALPEQQTHTIHRACAAAGLRLDTIDDPDCSLQFYTTTPAKSVLKTRLVNVVVGNPLRLSNWGYEGLVAAWLPDDFNQYWVDKTLIFLMPKIIKTHGMLKQRHLDANRLMTVVT